MKAHSDLRIDRRYAAVVSACFFLLWILSAALAQTSPTAAAARILKPDSDMRVNGIPIFAPTFRFTGSGVTFSGGGDLRNTVIDFSNANIEALVFTQVYSELGVLSGADGKPYVAYFVLEKKDRRIFVNENWVYFTGALRRVNVGGPFASAFIQCLRVGKGVAGVIVSINGISMKTDEDGFTDRIDLAGIRDRVLPLKIEEPGKRPFETQLALPVVSAGPVRVIYKGIVVNLS